MKELLKTSFKWAISIAFITFILAALFSITSNIVLNGVYWTTGLLVVLLIVFIGIFFDMIGIAATAADEVPFHAMASKKIYGSKHAIRLVRNADRVASFCNDVIGDISGIISGTATAIVIFQLAMELQQNGSNVSEYVINVLFTSVIASLTVGGKAFGKTLAIRYSKEIIFQVGKLLQFFEDKFHIVIIKEKKRKKSRKNIQ
jgi:CBS domain containing-hemolysin-like protein